MEAFEFSLTSLLIVTVLSFFIPLLIKRIKKIYIPVVVGEIIVGMIIGKSGFNIIAMDQSLEFIQFFGLAYLMFVAGLEIDFDIFFKKGLVKKNDSKATILKNPLILFTIILIITLGLAYAVSYLLMGYNLIKDPLLMSLIIGTTSLGIVVPILKEKKISATPYGQYLITGAVLADFVTMLLISVAVSIFEGGLQFEILLIFALLFLVFIMYRVSSRISNNKLFKELAHGTTQIGIRGSFALMILFLVLSNTIGVEMILGSFLAGTVISLVSQTQREEIYHKLDAIGFGFLIPTFFILVGVNFDLSVLLNNPKGLLLVPVLFVLFYIVKGVPVLLIRTVFSWRKTIAGGILLTSKLSLTIAAAAIGLKIGAISEEVSAALLLVSILTSLFSPILFGKMIPEYREKDDEKHVVVIGTTSQAIFLTKRLINLGIHVLVIESKREKAEEIIMNGIEAVWGDATDVTLLEELELNKSRSIIAATGSDEINYKIADTIINHFRNKEIILLLSDPIFINKAKENKLMRVVNPQLSTVSLLENMVRHPVAASIFDDTREVHLEEIEVVNPNLIGKSLRHIKLPGDVLIFAIYRNDETILPHGDTFFQLGDILLVLGTERDVEDFSRLAIG